MFGGSGGNYAYVVARVRALKTHLLDEDEYPKLIARDEHEIARTLQDGAYKQEVDELAADYAGAILVERATRLNMGRQFSRILSWCRGQPQAVLGHYFERYTVYNIKTVLRGAHSGASPEETEAALIPAGVVPMATWQAAMGTTDLRECLDQLTDVGYGTVLEAHKDQGLPAIENALDKAYYKHLLEAVPRSGRANEAFVRFVKREIDVTNLKTVLRAKHAGVDVPELVSGGQAVTEELARRILTAQWGEIGAFLDETDLGAIVKPAIAAYQESGDLNELVTALDRYHLRAADDFGHLYPLSILPIVDYVLHKQREVDRIRIIAFGKRSGLDTEDIEALVTA